MKSFVPFRLIVRVVAEAWGVSERAIYSHRRDGVTSEARHAVYWIAGNVIGLPLAVVGRMLGHRDHSTICHGRKRVEERMAVDAVFAVRLNDVQRAVETIGCMTAADNFTDPDPIAAAERVMHDPLGRGMSSVSNIELLAISARMLDLEDIAAGTFQLLMHIDALKGDAPPESRAEIRASGKALVDTIASALAALGYCPEPEEPPPQQQEAPHAVGA